MSYPKSSYVSQPAPVAADDAPRPPESVSLPDFMEAVRPLLALVGTEPEAVFADGFVVTEDEIQFVMAVPVPGVEPIAIGDDPEWQAYGWPVTVQVRRP